MISNSIGVSVLAALPVNSPSPDCTSTARSVPRSVEHLTYHWKTDPAGHPAAVLTLPPLNNCAAEQQRVWPITGLSLLQSLDEHAVKTTKLILLADIVCLNGNSAEKLLFEDYETALFVIHNPYDLPQMWRFEHKVFPDLGKANLKW